MGRVARAALGGNGLARRFGGVVRAALHSRRGIGPTRRGIINRKMNKTGRLGAIVLLIIISNTLLCAQKKTAQKKTATPPKFWQEIESVRPSVVKIAVFIPSAEQFAHRQDFPLCNNGIVCTVGTGFFVNSNGDVITAFHVIDGFRTPDGKDHPGIKQIQEQLQQHGLRSHIMIGTNVAPSQLPYTEAIENTVLFPVEVVATSPEHDLALLHITGDNPFSHPDPKLHPTNMTQSQVKFVKLLDKTSPAEGEDVFSCGYPFGQESLVTTKGVIASPDARHILLRPAAAGYPYKQTVYEVDLGINPGNSGGPVFATSDQSVIGVAVESLGSLGVVVPAYQVSEFLDKQHREWTSANSPEFVKPQHKKKLPR